VSSITLEGVRFVHADGTVALAGVDLAVADGECLAVIGPSGSGKTTLLRVMAGLEGVADGHVLVDGRSAADRTLRERDFTYMPQGDSLLATRDVAGQMAFPLEIRRMARGDIDQRVASESRVLGLGHLLRRKPQALSAGESQRVSLGRTRTRVPAALLLDEPLSRMDPPQRVRLRHDLRAYQRGAGLTTVVVSNDHDEALFLGQRVAVLRDGRVQQVGSPDAILRRPVTSWVAGFVGDPAMQVVEASVSHEAGLGYVHVGGQRIRFPGGLPGDLARRAGQTVLLGARPHVLRAPRTPDDAVDRRVRATVDHVIPMPDHRLVTVTLPGGRWQVPFPRDDGGRAAPAPGEVVEFVVDPRAMSVFDPVDDRAIWHGEAG
jgi:multiple sugar transport system ATP-binding protein